ncbi:MAG: hypothetical protein IJT66_00920 [Clostridia bacterium]|nr:hypothetical protein [Clostridia bacterium]
MTEKKRILLIRFMGILPFFIILIAHYSPLFSLQIGGVSPLSILPLLTAFAMFETLPAAAIMGLFTGICMDSVSSETVCFHAIFLLVAATASSLLSNNLFNKNLQAAAVLSFLLTLIYYLLRWLLFYAFSTVITDRFIYLLYIAFPSVLYTELFIVPFYFLYRYLEKRKGG